MGIKENILKMPVWKAGLCVLLFMFGMSIVVETVLSHTVFHVFDRMIAKFEVENKEDMKDLDDMGISEQRDYCEKYRSLLEEKKNIATRSKSDFSYDFAYNTMTGHESEIKSGIDHHQFNLAKCQKELKGKPA